jgi:hypothetical protein
VVPVHLQGSDINANSGSSKSKLAFVRFTIANLKPRNIQRPLPTYWLHFSLAYIFVFYAMWLIRYHYQVSVCCMPCCGLPRDRDTCCLLVLVVSSARKLAGAQQAQSRSTRMQQRFVVTR